MNNNVSIYPISEKQAFKKNQIIKKNSRALSQSLISEFLGYSLISEPITAREKHYSLVGYMLTVDIYFLLSNQSARKVLSTCLANTKFSYLSFCHFMDGFRIERLRGLVDNINSQFPYPYIPHHLCMSLTSSLWSFFFSVCQPAQLQAAAVGWELKHCYHCLVQCQDSSQMVGYFPSAALHVIVKYKYFSK